MSKTKKFIILIVSTLIFLTIALYLVGFFKPKGAGLLIQTTPTSNVFVDGKQVGTTPYSGIYEPGEKTVKLVPDSFETPLAPYETIVNLTSGVETVITREFGDSEESSAGETISFERAGKTETSVVVLSQPDGAQVKIDSVIRGFAPYKTTDIASGEYTLSLTAPGYKDRSVKIKTHEGHMLTAVVKLTKTNEVVMEETKETEIEKKTYIEISSTPTNFLRVRSEPVSSGEEVGKVTPGDSFELIEESEDGEWYKIEYKEDSEGWISATYSTKKDSGTNEISITPKSTQ